MGALDGFDIARAFHNADDAAVALLGKADLADLACGVILADAAAVQVLFGVLNGFCQFHGLLVGHAHDLVGHAGSAFAADAGKTGKLIYQIFQRL